MGLIYKPIGIVLGLIGALIGHRVFNVVWTKIDDEDPPKPTTHHTSWGKLFAVAALQGMIFKTIRVVIDRWGAIGWHYLTGSWPGEEYPDPEKS
jgi:hypothetical protein